MPDSSFNYPEIFKINEFDLSDSSDLIYNNYHNLEFNEPIKAGRCIDGEIRCCCDGPFVHPDGTVTHCGCINSRVIGNVLNEKSLMFLGDEQFDYCEICEPEKAKELQERYP